MKTCILMYISGKIRITGTDVHHEITTTVKRVPCMYSYSAMFLCNLMLSVFILSSSKAADNASPYGVMQMCCITPPTLQ